MPLRAALIAILGSIALAGCAAVRPARVAPFPTGEFLDDYGGRHAVSASEWRQGTSARYRIIKWDATRRFLVAQNDGANPTAPNRWTRIDWVMLEGMPPWEWAFCFSAYDAPTAEAAESTAVARPDTPRTGCNGFPYSRLRRDGAAGPAR